MEITKLQRHIAMNSPMALDWNKYRFLVDGEIIEFSSCQKTYNNAEFTINDDVSRKKWFSQLQQPGFSEDLKIIAFAGIKFQNEEPCGIYKISSEDFVEKVKGKKFKVEVFDNICYTINRQSNTLRTLSNQTIQGVINFVIKCIDNDKIEDLGDLIKTGSLYNLIEI